MRLTKAKLRVKRRVVIDPINEFGKKGFNDWGIIDSLAIGIDHGRGPNLYRNSVETPDYFPNDPEEEWYIPKNGSSQGDHIFAHATQICSLTRLLGIDNDKITPLTLENAISTTLHNTMIRWLGINVAFYHSWNASAQSDVLVRRIAKCTEAARALVETQRELHWEIKNSPDNGVFLPSPAEQRDVSLNFVRLSERYLNIYLEAYYTLILGSARKTGTYDYRASLAEASERRAANAALFRQSAQCIVFATPTESQLAKLERDLKGRGFSDLAGMFDRISQLSMHDVCLARKSFTTLSSVVDPNAFGSLFFKQAAPSARSLVIAHFILQIWLLFESLGWTKVQLVNFLETGRRRLDQPLNPGQFHGFVFVLSELLGAFEYTGNYRGNEFGRALDKAIDLLLHRGSHQALAFFEDEFR